MDVFVAIEFPPREQLSKYQFASSHGLICEQVRFGW
ncbi:hypothetical protein X757_07840 [Mesorhizobium sp. LSHC414A00]|nr:hypothetical protein X757_07840 [Mesorhizobium sp. LSHC414A00]